MHWNGALMGTYRWYCWALTGGTYGATLIIGALIFTVRGGEDYR
ncbi:unnamed protein product [Staurois parvus]|uniref:Uncharacterized protein n=1 Tax=Staurois parvus TaxID=386267 RepID=A0ABN9HC97_9NEOB|nr:unnamed protein product [Staurois parvus]